MPRRKKDTVTIAEPSASITVEGGQFHNATEPDPVPLVPIVVDEAYGVPQADPEVFTVVAVVAIVPDAGSALYRDKAGAPRHQPITEGQANFATMTREARSIGSTDAGAPSE